MARRVAVESFLAAGDDRPVVDVRTPAEFAQGHIPGAHNMPLFSDEERARVGTTYKQVGPEPALRLGLDLVGPKMGGFVDRAEQLASGRKIALHCWRGGKRSDSVGWLLEFAGFDVVLLEGGYKAYRTHVLEYFGATTFSLLILGGHTGSGKTEMLQEIGRLGEQIVDLEAIAHHKGSAFGALGEAPQPSVEQFENDLYQAFRNLDQRRRIWLENESRSIGRVFIPQGLWQQKERAPIIHVDVPLSIRVQRLVADYACYPKSELIESFERIKKRLGGQHLQAAIDALYQDDYATAAAIALNYYDKAYAHSIERRTPLAVHHLPMDRDDPAHVAREAVALANHFFPDTILQ